MTPTDHASITRLREEFHKILEKIPLSQSGKGKFERAGFNRLMGEILGVEEDDVYTVGTESPKAYNVKNRLAQGKALLQRHKAGVIVLGLPQATRHAIRYAKSFVGESRNFDSVVVVAKPAAEFQVEAVIEKANGPVAATLRNFFPTLRVVEPNPEPNDEEPEPDDIEGDQTPESETEDIIEQLPTEDRILVLVRTLLEDGFGGVVFRGPPGTSKSWYAERVAATLTNGDMSRVRSLQFHPSYQYEDFVEGFVPTSAGQFKLRRKHLLLACKLAEDVYPKPVVLIIDEISRVDPARVFGEALTYIESSKRGLHFRLASGRPAVIPPNVVLIGTMNVFDRGVDQVEAALERRLGFIEMNPDADELENILTANGMDSDLRKGVVTFFRWAQGQKNPYCRIGHAYFMSASDAESLWRLWKHQLRFVFERAFPTNQEEGMREVQRAWQKIFPSDNATAAEGRQQPASEGADAAGDEASRINPAAE